MRIAVLPSWYPDEKHPVRGIFIRDQVEVLSASFDVGVILPQAGWIGRSLGRREDPGAVSEGRAVVVGPPAVSWVPWSVRAGLRAWCRAAAEGLETLTATWGAPDLIHAHVSLPGGWAAVEIARESGLPVVLTEHLGPFDPVASAPKCLAEVRTALRGSAAVVAVSPHLRSEMLGFEPGISVDVLGEVVRTDLFTPASVPSSGSGTPTRFLAVGLLVEQKGFQFLIEASRILAGQGSAPFRVTIAGDGPLRVGLEQAASGLPITFAGMLDRRELIEQMRSCDSLVAPSPHESFGLVLGEAMACGRPVIATKSGGGEFVVPPGSGTLVAPGSSEELASAMGAVIRGDAEFDPGQIRADVAGRFGPSAFLVNLSKIYERVLGGS